jgi:acetyltransferase-like isoleucine patch superfamily enzyme
MRRLLEIIIVFFPQPLKRFAYRRLFGYEIAASARIGLTLLAGVDHVHLAEHAVIGHLNVVKGCRLVSLARGAGLGTRNRIEGVPASGNGRDPSLVLGANALISTGHVVDCWDRIDLGEFAVVGGHRSQIYTHVLDIDRDTYTTAPVRIGDHSIVWPGAILLPGSVVPDRSMVMHGSVVDSTTTGPPLSRFEGVPARACGALPPSAAWWSRAAWPISLDERGETIR